MSAVYSSEFVLRWGSKANLADMALDPDALMLISHRQYASRAEWNRTVKADHRLPSPQSKNQRMAWLEARSLISGRQVLVPAAHCLLGYPFAKAENFPVPDSSGLAAGQDFESSAVRALFELVERDAVSIWWYGRVPRPRMHVDQRKLPVFGRFEKWVSREGRQLWLLDLTHDLQIPVAAAVTCDNTGRNFSFGFAASWTSEEAAHLALGELVQFEMTKRMTLSMGVEDESSFVKRCAAASIVEWPFVPESAAAKSVSPAPLPNQPTALWRKLARDNGLEILGLDLTRRHSPLAVARVIVPSLRPIWPRFAPGRIFDVPFELGWHARKLREEDLNPISITY
jgi:ribosomal protein S12 methylthiotransferase accessory factor